MSIKPLVRFSVLSALLAAGYGVIFTVLDDYRDEYGIGETALGGVIGIGFASAFVAQIFIAPLADRGYARRLVLLGMALNVAGLVAMGFGTDLTSLLIGRFVMGVGIGTALPAIRRIIIVADPDNIGHNLGRLFSADVAGFAAGPAVSAVLVGPFGIAAPFLTVALATVVLTPLVHGHLVDGGPAPDSGSEPVLALDLLRRRDFAGAVVLGSGVFVMIGGFDALWAVVLADLNTADWIANLGITLFALPLIVLGAVGGRLAQRVGPFRVATIGLLAGALFMTLYGQVPSGGTMFAVAMVHALADGLTVTSSGVAVAMTSPTHRQAGAQGVLGGAQTLAAGIAAVVVGGVYETAGRAWAYGTTAAAMIALTIIGTILARSAFRTTMDTEGNVVVTTPRSTRRPSVWKAKATR